MNKPSISRNRFLSNTLGLLAIGLSVGAGIAFHWVAGVIVFLVCVALSFIVGRKYGI